MSEKILYILGAGASAQKLPISKTVSDEKGKVKIPGLSLELRNFNLGQFNHELINKEYVKITAEMDGRFKELAAQADVFGDVDTYAKYLNLIEPGGERIKILKKTVSEYFVVKQLVQGAKDPRYLPWLVSIMDRKEFPKNIKILSWNYDFQVEIGMSQIVPLDDVSYTETGFSYSGFHFYCFPNLDPTFDEYNRLSLIHLNGLAGYSKSGLIKTANAFQKKNSGNFDSILTFFQNNQIEDELHFAWEKTDYHRVLLDKIKELIYDASILVVVGYSFPFFNREVDKKIFDLLKTSLETIYYQDPTLSGQQLRSQFNLLAEIDIVHIPYTDKFHIPFEY